MDEDVDVPDWDVGAILDPSGELETYIYVAKKELKSKESLNLEIVYTSFKGTSQTQIMNGNTNI
jgi:hypothetical protein